MIKVSRVTPYIPINISQIKFIELTIYSCSLIPLFFFFFSLFYRFPLISLASSLLRLNSRPAQITYTRFEEEIRKETQRDISGVSLCGFLFFLHLREKRIKQMAILAISVFLSDPNVTSGISSSFVISFCFLRATL